jgi:hypothetical protein
MISGEDKSYVPTGEGCIVDPLCPPFICRASCPSTISTLAVLTFSIAVQSLAYLSYSCSSFVCSRLCCSSSNFSSCFWFFKICSSSDEDGLLGIGEGAGSFEGKSGWATVCMSCSCLLSSWSSCFDEGFDLLSFSLSNRTFSLTDGSLVRSGEKWTDNWGDLDLDGIE